MFCAQCGARNAQTNRFCRECGQPLAGAQESRDIPPEQVAAAVGLDSRTLLARSRERHEAGDLKGAIEFARQAVALEPDSAKLHSALGVLYEEMGMYRDAALAYREAIRLDPKDKLDRMRLKSLVERHPGLASIAEERKPERRAAPRRTRYLPVLAAAVVFLLTFAGGMLILLRAGAARGAEHLAQGESTGVQALIDSGKVAFKEGRYDQAARMFELALLRDPDNREALYWYTQAEDRARGRATGEESLPVGRLDLTELDKEEQREPTATPTPEVGTGLPPAQNTGAGASTSRRARPSAPAPTPRPPAAQPSASASSAPRTGEGAIFSHSSQMPRPRNPYQAITSGSRRPASGARSGGQFRRSVSANRSRAGLPLTEDVIREERAGATTAQGAGARRPATRRTRTGLPSSWSQATRPTNEIRPEGETTEPKPPATEARPATRGTITIRPSKPKGGAAARAPSSAAELQRRAFELKNAGRIAEAIKMFEAAREAYLKEGGPGAQAGAESCAEAIRALRGG